MSDFSKPIRHRALLVTFGPPEPHDSAVELANTLKTLALHGALLEGESQEQASNERVKHCAITTTNGKEASEQFSDALDELEADIKDAEEKITIYYGGDAFYHPVNRLQTSKDLRGYWVWKADADPQTCGNHSPSFNPVPSLLHFVQSVRNDVLLLLYCPINIHRHCKLSARASASRPNRSVQLIHSITPSSEDATVDLANQLRTYHEKFATVHSLLDDLTQAAEEDRPAPHWKPILGKPEDFMLSNPVTHESYQGQVRLEERIQTQGDKPYRPALLPHDAWPSSSTSASDTVVGSEIRDEVTSDDETRTTSGSTLVDSDEGSDSTTQAALTFHQRFPSFTKTESDVASVATSAPSIRLSLPLGNAPAMVVPRIARSASASVHGSGGTSVTGFLSHGGGSGGLGNAPEGSGQSHFADDDSSSSSESANGPDSDAESGEIAG